MPLSVSGLACNQNTPLTSKLYELVADNRVAELAALLEDQPSVVNVAKSCCVPNCHTAVFVLSGDPSTIWLALTMLFLCRKTKATVRSEDGRGPLWWAHEFKRSEIADLLIKFGAKTDEPDSNGILPNQA